MPLRLAIIDDSEELREMLKLRIEIEFTGVEIICYANPRDFLFAREERPDLVISDYCFGHITLDFFWEHMKGYRGVIYSGSTQASHLPWDLINKTKIERLLGVVQALRLAS